MPRDPEKYLYDMMEASGLVLEFSAGRTVGDYVRDRLFRSAVERQLQIIGEALVQLNKLAPEIARRISEYERIIGFRHVLVHGYDSLNHELAWYVVEHKLRGLHEEVRALLNPEGGGPA
jgi:uncharacterized protein with HEPN domain